MAQARKNAVKVASGAESWSTPREADCNSVLDEYAHVLVEHLGMAGRPLEKISKEVSKAIREALTLRRATLSADAIDVDSAGKVVKIADNEMRFHASFAVRYGGRSPEEARTVLREGDVQKAFNSPFRPFVLCSTSVGQEGLDFHLYCHAVMHWKPAVGFTESKPP
jgi:hypothetical protein